MTHGEMRNKAIETIAKSYALFMDPVEWRDLQPEAIAALEALGKAGYTILGPVITDQMVLAAELPTMETAGHPRAVFAAMAKIGDLTVEH